MNLVYSIIIPVHNRPNEIDELLESLTKQDISDDFEVLIIEDGSFLTDLLRGRLHIDGIERPILSTARSHLHRRQRITREKLLLLLLQVRDHCHCLG